MTPNITLRPVGTLLEESWKELRAKNWTLAAHLCEIVLAQEPSSADAARALAIAFWGLGRPQAAIDALNQASIRNPRDPWVWSDLGTLHYEAKNWPRAEEAFTASLRLQPIDLTALRGRAECLLRMHRYAEATPLFEACLRLAPERLSFACSLGHCLLGSNRPSEAERLAEEWLARSPHSSSLLLLLASIRHRQFRLDEALELTEAAVSLNQDSFVTRARLALACWNCGDIERAVVAREHAVALKPSDHNLHSNLAWLSLHDPNQSATGLLDIHRTTALTWASKIPPSLPHTNVPDPNRRLRVGYLSGEFTSNPAFCFLGSWLKHQDRKSLESFYYMSRPESPIDGQKYRAMADHWRSVWDLDDDAIAAQIRHDGIDVLVDLSGHFDDNRLSVFAQRLAPVQVAFPNYPSTTGVDEIDYIFTDIWTTPEGCENEYSETPYRLPAGYLMYELHEEAPQVTPLPALANGRVTFGLFQRPGKYHTKTWEAVAAILKQVPGSLLLFHFESADLDNERSSQRTRLTEALTAYGVDPGRLLFCGRRPLPEHLKIVGEVDIALDSFPYNGQTTTCDCLWMGVPVISLCGSSHVARVGQGLLQRASLGHLACESIDGYIGSAVELAADLQSLSKQRMGLRSQVSGTLGDGQRLAREIDEAYRWMWQRWCLTAKRT